MTTATILQAVRMRPVASTDDSFAAGEILTLWIGDEPWKLDELVLGGSTFNAVEIAEDGSIAVSTCTGGRLEDDHRQAARAYHRPRNDPGGENRY